MPFFLFSQSVEECSPLPAFGRDDAAAFAIGNAGYLVTGNHSGFSQSNRLWKYDPGTDSWSEKTAFPGIPRQYAGCFVIEKCAYITCGISESSVPLSDVWKYDPETDTWTQLNDFPGAARWSVFSLSCRNYGYMGTGATLSSFLKDVWKYNPKTDAWAQIAGYPGNECRETVGFTLGERFYAGLGYAADAGGEPVNDFYEFSTLSETWSEIAGLPGAARSYAAGISGESYGYAGTGYDADNNFLSDLYRYNPETKEWQLLDIPPFHPEGIRGMSAFALGNIPYFLTGLTGDSERVSSMWKIVAEPELTVSQSVYPNPSEGTLVIRSETGASIGVFTVTGQLVLELTSAGTTTFLENLPQGTFIVKLTTANSLLVERVVIL